MTARVTTLKSASACAYYLEQLPSYYLDSGEPRGVWFGDGAARLGLAGEVDDDAFLAVMAGMDPRQPERALGRRYDDDSVRGFDVTCSAPKSVSVLWALGDDHVRGEVLAAHDAAVEAMVGWIERHAHTRYRIAGQVAVVDAEGIVAARFRQHTSRALDPQLHTHVVIANRVASPDGRWLALDARTIKYDQRTLSALYHAGLRAELTDRLGVRWQEPERGIAELADVPEAVRVEFSQRTGDVERRIAEKLDRFTETMEREPTVRERWRLEREAVVDSRPAKPHGTTASELHSVWSDQVRALGLEPVSVVSDAVDVVEPAPLVSRDSEWSDHTLQALTEQQSTWRPAEITRELAAWIPTTTGMAAGELSAWLEQASERLADAECVDVSRPVPHGVLLRRDGRPVTEAATDRALTTQAILDQEAALIDWVDRRLVDDGTDNPDAADRSQRTLSVGQVHTAAATAGHADIVLVVGPAGTGKTTALTPAVEQLRAEGRPVFGVAPSATAAEVLGTETGVVADTIDKLLIEHRLPRPPDHVYDLPVGSTVIVDEAGMIPTPKLAELADLADDKGWRVVLVGDPLQFSAVGRGGMFGLLTETFGAIELDRVHRFTNPWERQASLQLRRGDQTVVDTYDDHGRLHAGTPDGIERAAVSHWWRHRRAGHDVLLMAPTNETVDRLNHRAQAFRLRADELDSAGRSIRIGDTTLYVGDEIATRHNDRRLRTDQGEMVRNRARWTITHIHPDQTITATGPSGTVRLPAPYVRDHVELAYASTGHAAQGRTVQHALVVIDKPTDLRNLYVPMTRGTESNHAYLAVTGEQTARDAFAQCLTTDWIDRPAHERQAELNGQRLHHPGLLDPARLRQMLDRRSEILEQLIDARETTETFPVAIAAAKKEHRAAETKLADLRQKLVDVEATIAEYDRPLKRRRHADDLTEARRAVDELPRLIDRAEVVVDALAGRAGQLQTALNAARRTIDQASPLLPELAHLDAVLDRDARARARHARLDPAHSSGERPRDLATGLEWDRVVGERAQHTAAYPEAPALADLLANLGQHSVDVDPGVPLDPNVGFELDL